MDIYAQMARDYMARSGATEADLAQVSVKAHRHGALNPKAQYGGPVSVDEVLASRVIAPPLRVLMCSPIGDGAAALVLATERGAYAARRRSGADAGRGRWCPDATGATASSAAPERAAQAAYGQAGIGPDDVDVVELHDAAAPAELIVTEELGLCEPGKGRAAVAVRRNRPGRPSAGQPQRGTAVKGPSGRCDRMRPARRADRPVARPLRGTPGPRRPHRARRKRRRLPRERRRRSHRRDPGEIAR